MSLVEKSSRSLQFPRWAMQGEGWPPSQELCVLYLVRALALLTFIVTGFTLLQPKTGWGRLVLFIPKLFAGTYLFPFALLGAVSAGVGWIAFHDFLSIALGLGAAAIGLSHISRLVRRSRHVVSQLASPETQRDLALPAMLPAPWIGFWQTEAETPWQRDIDVSLDERAGDGALADIWSPPASSQASGLGIIYLHGSGWHYADKDFGTRHFFRHLARQGHVVVDVAYPLAPEVDLFGMMAAIKRAIVWTKVRSAELSIHEDRLVLMGGSAGGHLALLAAYSPGQPRFDPPGLPKSTDVRAVVSYYGPADLRAQFDRFRELPALTGNSGFERSFMTYLENRTGFEIIPVHQLLPNLLGGSPQEKAELYDLASPINYCSARCPATLLLQGSHDFSGAAPQVVQLHQSLLQAGASSYLFELPNCEHGFDLYRPWWSPAAQAATYVTERFLASLL